MKPLGASSCQCPTGAPPTNARTLPICSALTFSTLTREIDEIEVLHVDAEGHDARILAQVDLDRWSLPVALFEHAHLSGDERETCASRLRAHGYQMWSNDWDTLAMR